MNKLTTKWDPAVYHTKNVSSINRFTIFDVPPRAPYIKYNIEALQSDCTRAIKRNTDSRFIHRGIGFKKATKLMMLKTFVML